MVTAAACAALPFKSEPEDAAVAEVFGTLLVSVAVMRMADSGKPNSVATTCATFTCKPWPISVPPWFSSTVPSVYTCSNAPAWLKRVDVKEMPNFTGVNARPRLMIG